MAKWESLKSIADSVRSGEVSALSLVEKAHQAIAEAEDYNAIIEVVKGRSVERAEQIDLRIKKGDNKGRLLGVPFIAKDNYLTFGSDSTAASNMLKGFKAPYQAEVVERLEAEGAIVVAKSNLDSFAHGGSTENSDFGVTKNPHDKTRVAGGSSGGSAAAVALGLAPFALGSDTGGSIRQPASFCGVLGMKPTYGISSRYGVVAMASSTDVMGPLANSAEDAALVMSIITGKSRFDSTTIDVPPMDTDLSREARGLRVGVIKEHMTDGVDSNVLEAVKASITKLEKAGAVISEVSLPSIDYALACYYVIMPAEVSSNLGRYDGLRFGYHDSSTPDLESSYEVSRAAGFNDEVKRRIMIGNYVLSSGYYDAYYKKAQQVRTLLIQEFAKALKGVDVMVGPVAPTTAFKIGENTEDPLKMYMSDVLTVAMNLTGNPAVSVPLSVENGLPVGIQITAGQREDQLILEVAKIIEGQQ